jgi:putative spermidine/putrescine transport system substrate-binding protein
MRKSVAILGFLVFIAAAVLTGGTSGAQKRFDGVTLRVGTWGGSWRDARHELIGKKLEALGARVEYVIGHPRDNFAKLLAARARGELPIDVMEISPEIRLTFEKQGLFEPLSYQALPNAGDLDAVYRMPNAVATQVIQIGIAYNTKKFEELGLPKPTSLADLFHPKLAGRVAMTDINTIEAPYILVGLALLGGGSPQNLEPGFKKLAELKPAYYYRASPDLSTKFTLGEIWAAPWHAGWVLRVRRTGFPMGHADIKVGGNQIVLAEELMGILKGTRARQAAEFWINEALAPAVQFEFAKKVGVIPTNPKALARVGDDPDLKDLVAWRPEQQKSVFRMNWDVVEPKVPAIVDQWNRTVGR